MIKTHYYAAALEEDTGYSSAGNAYLLDACGNIVYGVGQNDSELHSLPADEFRIVSPLRPPEGIWKFGRGSSQLGPVGIPDYNSGNLQRGNQPDSGRHLHH